jgi:hypothetical protein
MTAEKTITVKDENNNEIALIIRKPNSLDYRESQIEYNRAWRTATESGAYLREKLNDYLIKENVWSTEKQKQYEKYASDINKKESLLKKGGIPLKKARNIAVELKRLRIEFRDLISERIVYDNNAVEGQAENARFDAFVVSCVLYANTRERVFKDVEDYNLRSTEQIAIQAATELANLIYSLETSFEDSFLSKYKLVDSEGRLINKENHLISVGLDGSERLIDEKGNYIKYDENNVACFVDYNGNKVDPKPEDEFQPFLDDDGSPLDKDGNVILTENETDEDQTKDSETPEKITKKNKKKSD